MGFTGKQIIHPNQIPICQEAYSPSVEKIEWARQLIEGFEKHQKSGKVWSSDQFINFNNNVHIDNNLLRLLLVRERLLSWDKWSICHLSYKHATFYNLPKLSRKLPESNFSQHLWAFYRTICIIRWFIFCNVSCRVVDLKCIGSLYSHHVNRCVSHRKSWTYKLKPFISHAKKTYMPFQFP